MMTIDRNAFNSQHVLYSHVSTNIHRNRKSENDMIGFWCSVDFSATHSNPNLTQNGVWVMLNTKSEYITYNYHHPQYIILCCFMISSTL
jgi:hypothetical protein